MASLANPLVVIGAGAVCAALLIVLVPGVRRWLVSMRTAVWLLVLVALLAVAGVVVGQNFPESAYVERYGHVGGILVTRLGLDRVFSMWYFTATLALLTLSLVACAATRVARSFGRGRTLRATILGSFLTHLGIGVVLVGGLVTAVSGFRYPGARYLASGDVMDVPEGNFSLRVEEARTEFTKQGALTEYVSVVTVVEGGRDVRTERIEVNHPLVHNGIGIFQYEMLPAPNSFETGLIMAAVPDGAGDVRHEEFLIAPGVTVGVPGTDITLKAVEFIGHFSYDIETRTAAPASPFHRNPAVLVQVAEGGRALGEEWLFVGIRGHADGFGLPVRLFLLDYRPDFNAGLTRFQVSYQPGTPVMYAGFGAISVGIVLLFWFRPGPTGTGAIGEGASDRGRSAESGAAQSRGRGAGHRTAQDRVRDDAGRRPAGSGTEPRRGQGQGV